MDVNNFNSVNLSNYSETSSNLSHSLASSSSINTSPSEVDITQNQKSINNTNSEVSGKEFSTYKDNAKLKESIDELIKEVNEQLTPIDKEISYSLHEKLNRYIITIKDKNTGEVIRECPPKEQVDVFASILESAGLLFDEFS